MQADIPDSPIIMGAVCTSLVKWASEKTIRRSTDRQREWDKYDKEKEKNETLKPFLGCRLLLAALF